MKKIIFVICLFLSGCHSYFDDHPNNDISLHCVAEGIHYYKDSRTNLCFAGMDEYPHQTTLILVPCSPEVEKIAISLR